MLVRDMHNLIVFDISKQSLKKMFSLICASKTKQNHHFFTFGTNPLYFCATNVSIEGRFSHFSNMLEARD